MPDRRLNPLQALASGRSGRRNLRAIAKFLLVLAGMVLAYTIIFHLLMLWEGRDTSWFSGVYWTLTTMSTLGYGDITFTTDLGRAFSMLVLLSGMLFMLVMFPFAFFEFFYAPWMRSQAEARAPRQLPEETEGHVLLTNRDAVTTALIRRLKTYNRSYTILVPEIDEALRLHDQGLNVMVGDIDDPETWEKARVDTADLLVTTASDVTNTNVAFTVRGLAEDLPIVASALDDASVDILELAGATYVLRLGQMLGRSFARRAVGTDARAHVIGEFDDLLIAEAIPRGTPLVGQTLQEAQLRETLGATVVGTWERGHFEPGRADTEISDDTILVLAGSREHLDRYDAAYGGEAPPRDPVVILGGGRVGRATARGLARRGIDYRIVEPLEDRIGDPEKYVVGSAADLDVLERAGIREAPTVVITPRDDDLNVYLTIYCRQLRPNLQILARATEERNVPTMHRAGADSVLSYASMGTAAAMNVLEHGTMLTVAEGLNLFRVEVPTELAGRPLADAAIREDTGCSVVAISTERGTEVVPDPTQVLPPEADLVLVGTPRAETAFLERYTADG